MLLTRQIHDTAPVPAPAGQKSPPPAGPQPPPPPPAVSGQLAAAIQAVSSATGTVTKAATTTETVAEIGHAIDTANQVARAVANPTDYLMGKAGEYLDTGLANLTNGLSAMLPAFPAVSLGDSALGVPHAHTAHPPSGPPPVPPTPLPPMGPVLLGTCLSVLINGKPAARVGDVGLNPTCCGLPPMFEIFLGSSK